MLGNEQLSIVQEAKNFAQQELRPNARVYEEIGGVPSEIISKMAEKGYLAAPFPKQYNGLELDPIHYGLLTEEIGKGCPSTRALLTVHTSLVGESLLRYGNDAQKDKWLPLMAKGEKIAAFALTEPEVGTDASSIQSSYKRNQNGFILNGRKKWISYGNLADIFLVFATSEDKKVTAFIVERGFKGVSTKSMKGLLASRAAYVAEIDFKDVHIPEENVVGKIGNGFTFIANAALDYGRYSIAWGGVGIAQAALEEMVKYSRTRKQFGQAIAKFQLIKGMIADASTKIEAARALCLRAGQLRKEQAVDAVIETTIAKYFTSKIAMEITIDAVQVHGGNGCCSDYPVERLFREAKILEIIEGSSQIQQEIISNHALRRYSR